MDSNNSQVRSCYRRCCKWGRRTPIDLVKPYEGGPTPLFKSPQKRFYIVFTVINMLVFLTLLVTYIIQSKGETINRGCINIDSIYITVLVFAALNTLWYIFLARIELASDQEWHKYMVFMGLDTVAQLISVIATLYLTVKQYQNALLQGCFDEQKNIFIEIFVIICFNGVLVFIMGLSTFSLSIQLFAVNPSRYFYYRDEPDIKIKM